jgi:hypothetical protein
VLGVLPNSRYESAKISLRQRDVIVLYTDGAAKLRIQQDNNTPQNGCQGLSVCICTRVLAS